MLSAAVLFVSMLFVPLTAGGAATPGEAVVTVDFGKKIANVKSMSGFLALPSFLRVAQKNEAILSGWVRHDPD